MLVQTWTQNWKRKQRQNQLAPIVCSRELRGRWESVRCRNRTRSKPRVVIMWLQNPLLQRLRSWRVERHRQPVWATLQKRTLTVSSVRSCRRRPISKGKMSVLFYFGSNIEDISGTLSGVVAVIGSCQTPDSPWALTGVVVTMRVIRGPSPPALRISII